jgi:16S rRNA (adenine1518-N6/adenine1519-N6)-dimethyltransferase
VARLTAIEIDRDLARRLRPKLPANADIIVADVLQTDFEDLIGDGPVRVAGNLPYNISSPILFMLLRAARAGAAIVDATFMLQLEVAERLTAPVGTKEYGVLTILTMLHASVVRVLTLPPGAFRPMPRVRSAVVRLTFRPSPVSVTDEALLESLVRTLFMQRRKMLVNAIRAFADRTGVEPSRLLADAGIDGRRRPETLQLTELARLAEEGSSG